MNRLPSKKKIFEKMLLIRKVELKLLDLYARGFIRGTVHTCIGQEGCAVGVISAIDIKTDIIFSNHRGHGHYLAYCDDVKGLIAEILGSSEGASAGVGGSQHLHNNNFYSNGIQGAGVPVAVGMGLAEKFTGSNSVTLAFLGDGTFGEGVIYESFNLAALLKSPILFIVESNGYAQSTPTHLQHSGDFGKRAEPFGIPITIIDGSRVEEIIKITKKIIQDIRSGLGPQILYLNTYRVAPHSKGDDFRDQDEIIRMSKLHDPLTPLAQEINKLEREQIEESIELRIQKILNELGINL